MSELLSLLGDVGRATRGRGPAPRRRSRWRLHVVNHVLRSAAWCGVLAAAYPSAAVSVPARALTATPPGVALNAVAPARGGDAVKVGLVRAAVPGSSVATIAATMSVLVALDVVIGTVLLLARRA